MGRPSKLDADLVQRMGVAIASGASYMAASAAFGINKGTLERWRKRGSEAAKARGNGIDPDPADDLYVALVEEIDEALGKFKTESMALIHRAGIGVPVEETVTTTELDKDGKIVST